MRERAARGCSSAAAGRRAARRPTGPGCSRCAATCATPIQTRCARSSEPAPPSSPSSCPSCASASPSCPSRPRSRPKARASACSTRRPSSCGTRREARPIVLVLDDLHAADAPSLLLLRFLARELGSMPHARARRLPRRRSESRAAADRDAGRGRARAGDASSHARRAERARGRGVRRADGVGDRVRRSWSRALHEETEGNPLFVGEIVRLLAVEGVRSESTAEVRLAIPQSVRDVIARRLAPPLGRVQPGARRSRRCSAASSPSTRSLAWPASRRTSCSTCSTRRWPPASSSDVPGGAGRLRFAHVLIRDTLYEGLTSRPPRPVAPAGRRSARGALRRRAGTASRRARAPLPSPGSDFDKALALRRRAGDRALALLAYEEAARLYQTALDALDRADVRDERRAASCCSRSARRRCGRATLRPRSRLSSTPPASRDDSACRASSPAPRRATRGRHVSRARRGRRSARAAARGGAGRARRRGRRAAGQAARPPRRGAARRAVARSSRQAEQRGGRARPRTDNPAALAYALDGRVPRHHRPGHGRRMPRPRRRAPRGGRADRRHRAGRARAPASDHRTRSCSETRGEAGRRAPRDEPPRRRARQPAHLWEARAGKAMLALAAGRFTEAEELIDQALALGERAQARDGDSRATGSSDTHCATSEEASRSSSRRSASWSPNSRRARSSAARSLISTPARPTVRGQASAR